MFRFDAERPGDFFGPEDWTRGDIEDDVADIRLRQKVWDQAYALLTSWQRLVYQLLGSVRVDFELVLLGSPSYYGVYQDGVRLALPAPDPV